MTESTRLASMSRRAVRSIPPSLRREARRLGTRTWRVLRRVSMPIGHERLRAALDRVTGGGTDILLIHSSLSSCGHFTAGPGNVLSGFAACSNTLCLPTHTYCYPASQAEAGSLFDAATTPSQNGRLTELFRVQIGVTRSIHATHSLAASGPLAQEICANHYRCDSPSGAGTPYSRLVELHASVLMFGVSFHYYTLFHTAEFLSGSEHAFEQGTLDRLRIIDEGGQQRECWSRRQSRAPMRFAEAGELLERAGLARSETLGRSALLFVPDSSKVHDFLLERLKKTPDFLRQSCPVDLR